MSESKPYYSIQEVRSMVFGNGISTSLIQKMILKNEIPSERYGGRVLIPQYWVHTKIEEATHEPVVQK